MVTTFLVSTKQHVFHAMLGPIIPRFLQQRARRVPLERIHQVLERANVLVAHLDNTRQMRQCRRAFGAPQEASTMLLARRRATLAPLTHMQRPLAKSNA